jgi:hypothetical protein
MATPEERLDGLLSDLNELSTYLQVAMSKQFQANAQKDASNREFDLNQARMLDYQHHLWHEIAGLVEKLVKKYE